MPVAERTDTSTVLKAAAWMIGSITSFSAMAIAARQVSLELDTFEIMTYRSLVGVIVVFIALSLTRRWSEVTSNDLGLHVLRNVSHFTGQNLWFYAIPLIPLAQVFAWEFTAPLWVLLMAPFLLGEQLTRIRTMSAFIGFLGILIVARPSPETVNIGTLTAASAAIGFAGAIIFTKQLTRRTSLGCILFYMTTLQVTFGILCAGADGDVALPSPQAVPWLLLIGAGGLLAHVCLTKALSIAPATIVMPIDFTRLPLIAIIGYLLYSEPVDFFVIIGAVVIFGANYVNIWAETRT